MASVQKRGNRWVAEVRVKSQYKSKSFNTRIEAQSWALDLEKVLRGNDGIVTSKTLGNAFERYRDEVSRTKKGHHWERIRLNKFLKQDFSHLYLVNLSPDDINTWITEQLKFIQSSSVNRELNLISAVLETCRKQWKWIKTNPIRDITRPKNPRPRDRRISDYEIERILLALGYEEDGKITTVRQQIAVAFLFAIETAMRQGEIWGLTWRDIRLSESYLTLADTKNGTSRDVPLSTRAKELLNKLGDEQMGRVFSSNQKSAGTIFRRSLVLAGVEKLTFHDTRHEALTRLARKLDVLDLARMVGHRDPRSLMIYYNATASEIAGRLG